MWFWEFFKPLIWDKALKLELFLILEIFKVNTLSHKLCAACLRKDGFSFALPHDKGSSSSKHTRIKNIPLIDRVHIRSMYTKIVDYKYSTYTLCLDMSWYKNKSM